MNLLDLKGYAIAAGGAFVVGFGGCWWLRDQMAAHDALRAARGQVRQAVAVVAKVQKQDAVSAGVGARAEAKVQAVRTVTRTLVEKVPVYVTVQADARCSVPVGFVRLHDAAASGAVPAVPDPAGRPDDAASDVALSAVASTVANNYGACHEDQARLSGLQDWMRRQAALK